MSKHIVSLGDLVVDMIFPVQLPLTANNHQDIQGAKSEPGGACNFMIAASHIGAQVSAVGAVGGDGPGQELLQKLNAEGIDTSGVDQPSDAKTTLVLVLTDVAKHEHVFVGAYGEGRPAAYDEKAARIVQSANAIMVQGYTLYEKRMAIMAKEAIEHANAANIPVFLDAGPTLHQVTPDQIDWAVQHVDVIMMTEDEVGGVSAGRSGEEAYQYLLGRGAHTLVIKQGEKGCTVVQNGFQQQYRGFKVKVVDTVGAGDCFDAAFIMALLNGHDVGQAAIMANAMGAASVQKVGAGRSAPTLS